MALSEAQKNEIKRLYNLSPKKIMIAGAGYNDSLFYLDTKPNSGPVQFKGPHSTISRTYLFRVLPAAALKIVLRVTSKIKSHF